MELVAVDSRKVRVGATFYALKGERVDGHDFLEAAAEKGAVRAVVSEKYLGDSFGMELVREVDVLKSLQERAKRALAGRKSHLVGITGSIAKTTVKEFAGDLLAEKYRVARSKESYNGQIGLPISILEADPEAEVLLLEMGMSQEGEMARLIEIAPVQTALVTRISMSHSAYFSGIEEIAVQKGTIFTSPRLERALASAQAIEFAPIAKYVEEPFAMVEGPFAEDHLAECFSAAVAIAKALGLSDEEIARGAKKVRPFAHRFERVEKEGIVFIDDSYNANVDSMCAALRNLPEGRRIAVLGEMGELGEYTEAAHRSVGAYAKGRVDMVLGFGENSRLYCDAFGGGEWFMDFEKLRKRLYEIAGEGDVVLLKGANTKRLWRLMEK